MNARRPQIHQLVVGATAGDAITGIATRWRALLRGRGESEVYGRYVDAALQGDIKTLNHLESRRGHPDDVLLYHVSIGDERVATAIADRPERLVIVYHNITPSRFFEGVDAEYAIRLAAGRRHLGSLVSRAEAAFALSEYNAAELRALGFEGVEVVTPVLDLARLHDVDPDMGTWHHLSTRVKGPVILAVGQLLPHKRPDLLLAAFEVLVTYSDPECHLIIAGIDRIPAYTAALRLLARRFGLHNAWIAGAVTDAQLAAMYRRADLFVNVSEHEGLCVPVVEAMSFDVPVVARDFGALAETIDGAGLVLPASSGPIEVAEGWREGLGHAALRSELSRRRHDRLAHFDAARCGDRFMAAVDQVLSR